MEKILIKSVQNFCELSQNIEGKITLDSGQWSYGGDTADVRFRPESLTLSYSFQGFKDDKGYYIAGQLKGTVPCYCSRCSESCDIHLSQTYSKIYLKDSQSSCPEGEYDIIECWPTNFNIMPWLLSEIIIQVPISPKHDRCEIKLPSSYEEKNKILSKDELFKK